jgi:membrane protein YqaA with SNARE-associated domain
LQLTCRQCSSPLCGTNIIPFTILVFAAKTGRYVVLTLATLEILG